MIFITTYIRKINITELMSMKLRHINTLYYLAFQRRLSELEEEKKKKLEEENKNKQKSKDENKKNYDDRLRSIGQRVPAKLRNNTDSNKEPKMPNLSMPSLSNIDIDELEDELY